MAEMLSLTGANGVSEIHIETGLLIPVYLRKRSVEHRPPAMLHYNMYQISLSTAAATARSAFMVWWNES